MSASNILLGYEVSSGEPVNLPLHHLAIFGMTQLSGKTTTLEALISRSELRAIAFKTKRGESGFSCAAPIIPYYKPRADWQYVEGLVNVALGEKVKYEPGMRYAIMKVCRGRKDLVEIQQEARRLAKETKKEFMKSVYEKLDAYLDIVIPELKKWTFTERLELSEGVNVMDLADMRLETQQLVIASTIEYALTKLDHVVVIVPEAWEMLPQGRMTPVKWVAQQFIRKGAAIGNYLWLDSQDIGGIDKTPLRQCDNWIMGRMKEAHEVERILKQLLGVKVAAEEIQTLSLGHFYAAIGNQVKKVYVLPVGVPEDVGVEVAKGLRTPESVRDEFIKKVKVTEEEELYRRKYEDLLKGVEEIRAKAFEEGQANLSKDVIEDNKFLSDRVKELEAKLNDRAKAHSKIEEEYEKERQKAVKLISELQDKLKHFEYFEEALRGILEPYMVNLFKVARETAAQTQISQNTTTELTIQPERLKVKVEGETVKHVKVQTSTIKGQVLYVAAKELPKTGWTEDEAKAKMAEHSWNVDHNTLAPTLGGLTKEGILIRIEGKKPYQYRLPTYVEYE